ncbi:gamma-glutamylcyclotransferase family protein [Paenibacillus sp. Soil522]|uniref:gamma-glutamylcyclotransferase family protein n=1 Tax=Paenibacillus sp. Soil522 TaxID=1736388 RepID=UPI0006FBE84E|nr:gamma-glutamylcyclotransferase family protein [Paenibacillus sp. Soil522]KRE41188.1 hypothetical protein ASG81_16700 [Paenibacillus sp. Soil522]
MTQQILVFIYGSLLPGHSNHYIVSSYVQCYKPGQIAGRMVDCGAYPAAVRDSAARQCNSIIRGQWITVDRQGLAAMDALEEFYGIEEQNDYHRIWVFDSVNRSVSGWVYVWDTSRGFPAIADAYWPDFFARKITDAL